MTKQLQLVQTIYGVHKTKVDELMLKYADDFLDGEAKSLGSSFKHAEFFEFTVGDVFSDDVADTKEGKAYQESLNEDGLVWEAELFIFAAWCNTLLRANRDKYIAIVLYLLDSSTYIPFNC